MSPANPKHTYVALDGLRGVAAIAVVLFHYSFHFGDRFLFPSGHLAVDYFFVLSGFVIAYAYEDRLRTTMTKWEFVKVRLIRLYPLYLLSLVLFALYVSLAGVTTIRIVSSYLAALFLVPLPPGWAIDPHSAFPLNYPSWSLSLEILVNLLYVVILPFLTTRRLVILCVLSGLACIGIVYSWGSLDVGCNWDTYFYGYPRVFWGFFIGVLLYRLHSRTNRRTYPQWITFLLAAVLVVSFCCPSIQVVFPLLVFPLMVWIGAAVTSAGLMKRVCAMLGQVSYAVYVCHMSIFFGFIAAIHQLGMDATAHVRAYTFVCTPLLVILCVIIDVAYDQPVRRKLASLLRRG